VTGRGAWPGSGRGGTLNAKGTAPGPYYRAPADGATVEAPGLTAYRALQSGNPAALDDLAVYYGVLAIQNVLRGLDGTVAADGVFGPRTGAAVKAFQTRTGLAADGVVGPNTTKRMFQGAISAAAAASNVPAKIVGGIAVTESSLDPGAVGYYDDNDLGLVQINGVAHPNVSVAARFTPAIALQWCADYLHTMLGKFGGRLDDAIAAYNLGEGGCRQWIAAERPDVWTPPYDTSGRARDVRGYIDRISTAYTV
jgi:hypothetical protein